MFKSEIGMDNDSQTPVMTCMPAVKIRTARLFVSNASGMHLRPAARLAKAVQEFVAEVTMQHGRRSATTRWTALKLSETDKSLRRQQRRLSRSGKK